MKMRPLIVIALFLAAPFLAAPATAATRGYTITSFDKVRVTGPFTVNIRTGAGPSARAQGSPQGIDQLRVEVHGTTLVVSADRNAWGASDRGDRGPVILDVTTPGLSSAILSGSGALAIDRVRAARFDLSATGSGDVTIGALATEQLVVTVTGSGTAKLAGRTAQARLLVQGSGSIAAPGLIASDLDATVNGSGEVRMDATRAAWIKASGAGDVDIGGTASCIVHATGSGDVRCGKGG